MRLRKSDGIFFCVKEVMPLRKIQFLYNYLLSKKRKEYDLLLSGNNRI